MGKEVESQRANAAAVPEKTHVAVPPGSAVVTTNAESDPASNDNSGLPMWQQEKMGDKCCGCCCDYRRAVFVLASITLFASVVLLILSATADSVPGVQIDTEDDELMEIFDDAVTADIIMSSISILCAICALVGAYKFNIYLVGLNVIWYIASFIATTIILVKAIDEINRIWDGHEVNAIPSIVMNLVVTLLYIYPHIGFIDEVNKGIMSSETYPREEFSCCCGPIERQG